MQSLSRIEFLSHPLPTVEVAKAWIEELHRRELSFHFEDSPETIVSTLGTNLPDGRVFTDEEAVEVRKRVDELYGFAWGEHECPIGYLLDVSEPGWKER